MAITLDELRRGTSDEASTTVLSDGVDLADYKRVDDGRVFNIRAEIYEAGDHVRFVVPWLVALNSERSWDGRQNDSYVEFIAMIAIHRASPSHLCRGPPD